MKIYYWILFSLWMLSLFSCTFSDTALSKNQVQTGTATISGRVVNASLKEKDRPIIFILQFYNPITTKNAEYKTSLLEDGSFTFEVPVECKCIGFLYSDIYYGGLCLVPNEETKLTITFDEKRQPNIDMNSNMGLTVEDLKNLNEVSGEVLTATQNDVNLSLKQNIQPSEYSEFIINKWENDYLPIVDKSTKLSNGAKQILKNSLRLFYLDNNLLNYENKIDSSYALDKSYYSFLKKFHLNNAQYLYSDYFYYNVLQSILSNKTFNIPRIGDMPIENWLKIVTTSIADLIGTDSGFFYDMIVNYAYVEQFNDETKPLSNKQIQNIKNYFTNKSFVDILLTENEKITKVADITSHLTVNETPSISKEELTAVQNNKQPQGKLIDTIVSKYKGNVVIIDFGATWCAPCLQGMRESRPLKQEMLDKNVVFVYITEDSSPKELWKKKIQGIGGEHYYLTGKEWESISYSDKYGFEGIPTYLIFDSNGKLEHKITTYPGNEKMRAMIEKLLL